MTAEEFAIGRRHIMELAEAAGRNPDELVMSVRVEVEAHERPSSDRAADRARLPGDDAAGMAAGIAAFREAGVSHLVMALNTGDVSRIRELMQVIAADVIPQFR